MASKLYISMTIQESRCYKMEVTKENHNDLSAIIQVIMPDSHFDLRFNKKISPVHKPC